MNAGVRLVAMVNPDVKVVHGNGKIKWPALAFGQSQGPLAEWGSKIFFVGADGSEKPTPKGPGTLIGAFLVRFG